jgi:hypothetical protein
MSICILVLAAFDRTPENVSPPPSPVKINELESLKFAEFIDPSTKRRGWGGQLQIRYNCQHVIARAFDEDVLVWYATSVAATLTNLVHKTVP